MTATSSMIWNYLNHIITLDHPDNIYWKAAIEKGSMAWEFTKPHINPLLP